MKFFSFLLLVFILSSCTSEAESLNEVISDRPTKSINRTITLRNDTIINVPFNDQQIEVRLLYPKSSPTRVLLLLQGWNFPNTSWCDSTIICEEALSKGYVLVCPDMGKSIYASVTYPETRKDWLKYPTRSWISNNLITTLQSDFELLSEESDNYVLGLSTGGRGAVLLCMDHPELFRAGATLSGDFNQSKYRNDNLYKGFFGVYTEGDRWGGSENPIHLLSELQTPIFIGHGSDDNIVSKQHSEELKNAIDVLNSERAVKVPYSFSIEEGGEHNYSYWNSQVGDILSFFDKYKK